METKVFDRVEKKYLLTKEDKSAMLKAIRAHMNHDKYYKSEVLNLYFDNQNYDLINQSIDWVGFKEKLRARSYGGYDRVFLEIKTKIKRPDNNVGYKRRVMITHEDFEKLLRHEKTMLELAELSIEKQNDLQIAREVDYFLKHFNLEPKIFVTYKRESYKGENDLRITFDERLRYRNRNLSLKKSKNDKIYFKDDHNIIMEIKANGPLPLWLVEQMSRHKIYPQRFSKIGHVYQQIRKEQNV